MSGPLVVSAAAAGLASSLIPIVNAEVILVGLVLASPPAALLLAFGMACGQMVGKTALFLGSERLTRAALAARLATWRLDRCPKRARGLLVLLSATVGVPPLYLVSVAAPVLGVRLPSFVVFGLTGRLVRFAAIASVAGALP